MSDLGQSIFESEELQTLESLLRLIDNAHQDIPLASVLLSPLFGVDADRLARARLVGGKLDLYDAVCLAASEDAVLARFLTVLSELRDAAELLPLHGLYELILEKRMSDREIADLLEVSIKSIHNRRARLKQIQIYGTQVW